MTGPAFDAKMIRNLANILNDTNLTEIELAEGDMKVRVARSPAAQYITQKTQEFSVPASASSGNASAALPQEAAPSADKVTDLSRHPGAVKSPMVGVAYLTPDPDSPPFITVGQEVKEGQTLLLIEAMKTFNQIKAHKSGKVARILVKSSAPVEYGEVLIIVE